MSEGLLAIATAAWLGILTSISPCPLAANIAAVSFVGRSVRNPRTAVIAGLVYALGRTTTYVLVAVLVVSSVLSIPGLSLFLQQRMNQVLGPLLILVGAGLLGWYHLPVPSPRWTRAGPRSNREISIPAAGALGLLFALSFCPVSAGLFFGALIPLAISHNSHVMLPFIYGIGTGLPVILFAVLIALGAHWVGRAFNILASVEKRARQATGLIFLLCGIYLTATHVFGLSFP